MKKKSNKQWKIIIGVLLFCVIGLSISLKYNIEKRGIFNHGIPQINIQLNEVSLEEIKAGSKETKYNGNILTLYNENQVDKYSNVEIKGRGNSTWKHPKKPYQIKFSSNVDLLNIGKVRKWVLLTSFSDNTFLRNDIAFMLAEMLEMEYSYRGEFIELYFDNEYEGLYYLVPKISIAKGSVDLRNENGVIFELDNAYGDEEDYYESIMGNKLVLKDIVAEQENSKKEAVEMFLDDFNKLEIAAKKKDYKTVSEIIDIESFIKYYLVNEFTVNPDAYSTSFYLYKDGEEDKIHAGPVWDFDLALSNHAWGWEVDERFYSPSEEMIRKREAFGQDDLKEDKTISKLIYYLMEIPEFKKEVKLVFQEKMMGKEEDFIKAIVEKRNDILNAVNINNEKWNISDSENDFSELLDWIENRYDSFEYKYGDQTEKVIDQRYYQFL